MRNTYEIAELLNNSKATYSAMRRLRSMLHRVTGITFDYHTCREFLDEAVRLKWYFEDEQFLRMFLVFNAEHTSEEINNFFDKYHELHNVSQQFMGKLVGWRAFRYYNHNLGPVSHREFKFDPFGLNVDDKPEPEVDNEYGFWAFKTKRDIMDYMHYSDWHRHDSLVTIIYCPVSLSGTVIEHELGYRASQLEILGMYSKVNNSRRRGVAHKLGWPGKIYNLNDGPEVFSNTLVEIPDAES